MLYLSIANLWRNFDNRATFKDMLQKEQVWIKYAERTVCLQDYMKPGDDSSVSYAGINECWLSS